MTEKEKLDAILNNELESTRDNKETQQVEEIPQNEASQYLGTTLNHNPLNGQPFNQDNSKDSTLAKEKHLTRIGETIGENAEIRDGWIDVDRARLGDRSTFYPESWRFRIRPATVEAIRNWSMIDDEDPLTIDDVFNEVLKSCLAIVTPEGPKPWGNICSWDRFFWLLMIREYTFKHGDGKLEYEEDCPECGNPVKFNLTSLSLMYEMPDIEVMPMYDRESREWHIDPMEYDVNHEPITFYLPTLEKEANIKKYMIARANENRNTKFDRVFLKFAPWLSPKISKDDTIAKRQMRELEMIYKSWDENEFSLFDEVIRNITVMPERNLISVCPTCGEEVTSQIRFPGSVSSLFSLSNKRRKFGSK